MRKRYLTLLLALCLLTGCGSRRAQVTAETEQTAAQAEMAKAPDTTAVADASQMTAVRDVAEEGMTPVYAAALKGGVYPVAVDSSSSMFKIERCELTVEGEAMLAELTMSSDAYAYLYPGTAEEAAAADESRYLTPRERSFVFPLEALDKGVPCAAWSRNKELWYDRTLVFRSDSLPLTAFRELTTAESLGLADDRYSAAVTLTGGSGKASVQSPAELTVRRGAAEARIVWGSGNYDYMLLDGTRYDAEEDPSGNSAFTIPVAAFDRPIRVTADTTAMSKPHEIDYTLTFESLTLERTQ